VGGFRFVLDIEVNNLKLLDAAWIWSFWKNFGSNPIAKFPYPYIRDGKVQDFSGPDRP